MSEDSGSPRDTAPAIDGAESGAKEPTERVAEERDAQSLQENENDYSELLPRVPKKGLVSAENDDSPESPTEGLGSSENNDESPSECLASMENNDDPRSPSEDLASSGYSDDGTESLSEAKRKLDAALRGLARMNAVLATQRSAASTTDSLMAALGKARRRNTWLQQLLGVLAVLLAFTAAAVASFVTPESFEAWREGIAIQLIRRAPQTSMSSLYARRSFGYLVERAFFEVPYALLAALKRPGLVACFAVLAFPAAAVARALAAVHRWSDVNLAAALFLAANLLFLGDDFSLPGHKRMADAGMFVVLVSTAVLALPSALACVHKPAPWGRYRSQILAALRAQGAAADDGGAESAPRLRRVAAAAQSRRPWRPGTLVRRAWLRLALSQQQFRPTRASERAQLAALVGAIAVVATVDTLIAHN